MLKKISVSLFLLLVLFQVERVQAGLLDRIVAVVENDVILDSELTREANAIKRRLQENKVMIPPDFILRKQVLERLVLEKLQLQRARQIGIHVTDDMLRQAIADIAARNGLSVEQFRQQLESQGINFAAFQDSIRKEMIINHLRAREIGSRIKVTDREVQHFLETQGDIGKEKVRYRLGHILIAVSEAASATTIQKALDKARRVVKELRQGADFKEKAVAVSDGGNALRGGDLGWRTMSQIPTLFVDVVSKMKKGEVSDPIRSPSGFHIIKILDMKGLNRHIITKTKVRHILIKTNELINDEEAQKRLRALKERIQDGDDFGALARAHSDDKGSAIKGGDLGWVVPGVLVPPFEQAMNRLKVGEISEPVQTQFGWHIIQVLDRKQQDDSLEFKKNKVRDEIRKQKMEEETELWLRRLRDEAFVEIYLDRI
jgi:peptidyl-prolyl cis-trans isomerase SurA